MMTINAPTSVAEEVAGYVQEMSKVSNAGAGDLSLRAADLHKTLVDVNPDQLSNKELCTLADKALKINREFDIATKTPHS